MDTNATLKAMWKLRELADHLHRCSEIDPTGHWDRWEKTIREGLDAWQEDHDERDRLELAEAFR